MKKLIVFMLIALIIITSVSAFSGWINPDETVYEGKDSFTLKHPIKKKNVDYNTILLASTQDGLVHLELGKTIRTKLFTYTLHERAAADNIEKTGYLFKYRITIEKQQAKVSVSRTIDKRNFKLSERAEVTTVIRNIGSQHASDLVYEDYYPSYFAREGPIKVLAGERSSVYSGPQVEGKVKWTGQVSSGQEITLSYTLKLVSSPPTPQIIFQPATLTSRPTDETMNTTKLEVKFVSPLQIVFTMPETFAVGKLSEMNIILKNTLPDISLMVDSFKLYAPSGVSLRIPNEMLEAGDHSEWSGRIQQASKKDLRLVATINGPVEHPLRIFLNAHYGDKDIFLNVSQPINVNSTALEPSIKLVGSADSGQEVTLEFYMNNPTRETVTLDAIMKSSLFATIHKQMGVPSNKNSKKPVLVHRQTVVVPPLEDDTPFTISFYGNSYLFGAKDTFETSKTILFKKSNAPRQFTVVHNFTQGSSEEQENNQSQNQSKLVVGFIYKGTVVGKPSSLKVHIVAGRIDYTEEIPAKNLTDVLEHGYVHTFELGELKKVPVTTTLIYGVVDRQHTESKKETLTLPGYVEPPAPVPQKKTSQLNQNQTVNATLSNASRVNTSAQNVSASSSTSIPTIITPRKTVSRLTLIYLSLIIVFVGVPLGYYFYNRMKK